jgi:hypothetical protein
MLRRSEVLDNLAFLRKLESASTPARRKTVLKRASHGALCVLAKLIYYVISGQAESLVTPTTRQTLKEAQKRKIRILKKAFGSRAKVSRLQSQPQELLDQLIKINPLLPVFTNLLWKNGSEDAGYSRVSETEKKNERDSDKQDASDDTLQDT